MPCCELTNQLDSPAFSEQEEDDYVLMLFLGVITTQDLSTSYDFRIRQILEEALFLGYGATLAELTPGTADYVLLESFKDNIAKFTASKQYQQVREMQSFLGLSKEDFLENAKTIFGTYNDAWLNTEYDTTFNAAKSGRKWVGFEQDKKNKPFLTYNTQRDSRVRPEHAALDGITKRVTDPFWNSWTPPNGWNCRCFLTSSANKEVTPDSVIPFDQMKKEIPELFRFNPGKTGLVFSPLHPYFDVERGDVALRRRNFNIPV